LQSIKSGVPQGSVLGPLLFLIYDISQNMLSISRLFADDMSLQYASGSTDEIEFTINHDLKIVNDWSQQWLMSFNTSNTKVMFFSYKNYIDLPKITFQNCDLECINTHKYIGLNFSCDARWTEHI